MFQKAQIKWMNALRALAILAGSTCISGCVVLLPFTEPDEQAVRLNEELSARQCGMSTQSQEARGNFQQPRVQRQSSLSRYIQTLESGGATERANAAYWVGEMGSAAESAIPVLTRNLNHPNHWVRRASAKALGKIGNPSVVPALAGALKDSNKFVAHSAANALRKINTSAARKALQNYRGI